MADKKVQDVSANDADLMMQRARGFWGKFSKPIIYVGAALIFVIGGYFGYKYLYKLPKEDKANQNIIAAENLFDKMAMNHTFNKDSVNIVLNGVANRPGFPKVIGLLSIIKDYSGTDAGNRARFLAGACYIHTGEFEKGIKQLKEFEPNGTLAAFPYYDLLAVANAELKKNDDALSYYKKEVSINSKEEVLTPAALKRAGDFCYHIGKLKEAAEFYQRIKDEYPTSTEGARGAIDKDLARLGQTEQ
ncbi:MAG: tetratricopeptide repeat protein [Ferruginibacter sp.]